MNIEVDPGAVIGRTGTVEVEDAALVPALIILVDARQVERRKAEVGVLVDARGTAQVVVLDVWVVPVVPDVDRDLVMLQLQLRVSLTLFVLGGYFDLWPVIIGTENVILCNLVACTLKY